MKQNSGPIHYKSKTIMNIDGRKTYTYDRVTEGSIHASYADLDRQRTMNTKKRNVIHGASKFFLIKQKQEPLAQV